MRDADSPRAAALAILLALAASPLPLASEEGEPAPYSLSADASCGFLLAYPSLDPRAAGGALGGAEGSVALWTLSADFLHRLEGAGWGAVLNHRIDLSGNAPSASVAGTVYEAYARLDLGDAASLAIGKRRMLLGLGTAFAPGDLVNPRSGFWDQKEGFRGLSFAGSLGSDFALRAALSLEDCLAARSADLSLVAWALSAELQAGSLQLALGGTLKPGEIARPSLGASIDVMGLILQAEAAVELEGGPDWYADGGARYAIYSDAVEATLSIDGEYGGGRALSGKLYLLPAASVSATGYGSAYARAIVDLEGRSALLSTGLTASPLEDLELELSAAFALGDDGAEFSRLPAFPDPAKAFGLAARIHF
jgi:hypothetical protein